MMSPFVFVCVCACVCVCEVCVCVCVCVRVCVRAHYASRSSPSRLLSHFFVLQRLLLQEEAVTMAEPLSLRIRIVKTNTLKMMQVSVRGDR